MLSGPSPFSESSRSLRVNSRIPRLPNHSIPNRLLNQIVHNVYPIIQSELYPIARRVVPLIHEEMPARFKKPKERTVRLNKKRADIAHGSSEVHGIKFFL